MLFVDYQILLVKHQLFCGSVAAESFGNPSMPSETDTIAGEDTSAPNEKLESSSNIDVVGLAVFKGDILVRRINCRRNGMSFNCYK